MSSRKSIIAASRTLTSGSLRYCPAGAPIEAHLHHLGKADEIESQPTGGNYERPASEGGGQTSTYAFEQWRYRYNGGHRPQHHH